MHAAQRTSAKDRTKLVRGVLIGAALFAATSAFCLWQNTRVAALFDLSYLLDTSWRISLGQLPYRDFPFAHAPGTFLLHAAIIKIFGRVYWPHVACAALESGAATVIVWRLLLQVLRPLQAGSQWLAALLAATLVPLGVYSIYPHPIYDSDCLFTVLLALYLIARAADCWEVETLISNASDARRGIAVRNILAGAVCVVPLFFKQNIGLAFLAAVLVGVFAIAAARATRRQPVAAQLWFLSGIAAAIAFAASAIHFTVGTANYHYWTMTFAAQRRLPGIAILLGVYRQVSLLWTVPAAIAGVVLLRTRKMNGRYWLHIAALLLLAAPFIWTIVELLLASDSDDRAGQLLSLWPHLLVFAIILAIIQIVRLTRRHTSVFSALLPLLLLATIHGTFLSQQLWGSTYAMWPLLVLLIALLLLEVREVATPLAAIISTTLLLCGSLYAASLERLDYIHLDGPETHVTLPALRGLATPGLWLPEFEEMVRFTGAAIPPEDGIALVPGEEPFYFTTGRTPQFPVLLTDLATDPYTPQQTVIEMRSHNIRWLIAKRDLQLTAQPAYETPELLRALQQEFVLYRRLPGYDIYRRP